MHDDPRPVVAKKGDRFFSDQQISRLKQLTAGDSPVSEETALRAAIAAAPDDDAPRLVYADWLDEHGRADQADAIRVEHTLRITQSRWEALRARMDPEWMAQVFPANAVVIQSYPPDRKISVIKLIRELTGCGLAEAKALSESLPVRLKGDWSHSAIDRIREEFRSIGVEADRGYVVPQ